MGCVRNSQYKSNKPLPGTKSDKKKFSLPFNKQNYGNNGQYPFKTINYFLR